MTTGITREGLDVILDLMEEKIASAVLPYQEKIKSLEDKLAKTEMTLKVVAEDSHQRILKAAQDIDIAIELFGATDSKFSKFFDETEQKIKEVEEYEVELRLSLENVYEDFKKCEELRAEDRHKSLELEKQFANAFEKLEKEIEKKIYDEDCRFHCLSMEEIEKHRVYIEDCRSKDYIRMLERLEEINRIRPELNKATLYEQGMDYRLGESVFHRGGIWHCVKNTDEEPHYQCSDWVCSSTGLAGMKVIEQHPNGVNASIAIIDSIGNTDEIVVRLPTVNRLAGAWEENKEYRQLDSIMCNGVRWIATRDFPDGKPGESEHWVVESMRGPQGKQGKPGKQGPAGKSVDFSVEDVIEQIKAIESQNGHQISRFAGTWKAWDKYLPGDVVLFNKHLWLAKAENAHSTPPMENLSSWVLMGDINE